MTDAVEELQGSLQSLLSAFSHFTLGKEDIAPGDAELSVLIPREAVASELPKLGEELLQIQRVLGPFSELATGLRRPLTVNTIASSDFGLFMAIDFQTAKLIVEAVGLINKTYEIIGRLRTNTQGLRDDALGDDLLALIDERINTKMAEANTAAAEELVVTNTKIDDGRKQELRTEVRLSLNALANRIDHGYNIDVRMGPIPNGTADPETAEAARVIITAGEALKYFKPAGRPILSLPEPTADADS